MQEKFASLQTEVGDQLTGFRDYQVQTSDQLKDSVQTNFSRLGCELRETNKELSDKVQSSLVDLTGKIQELSVANEQKQDALRQVVESRLDKLTDTNNEKLEQMRQTVDEKLHTTLEKRLTDSFGLVTEQLGRVQLGLGEMKDLAKRPPRQSRKSTLIRRQPPILRSCFSRQRASLRKSCGARV